MGSRENFALRWNDFHGNISSSFKQLRESPEFQDVTLFCDKDNSVKAHKVILSACSPYFHSALTAASSFQSHPVLLLPRSVDPVHLTRLVDFMYYGEVSVQEEQLDKFLKLAEMLQVRGLVPDEEAPPEPPSYPQPSHTQTSVRGQSPAPRKRRLSGDPMGGPTQQRQPRPHKVAGGEPEEAPPPPSSSQMVGLVCPQCRTICRGVPALESHMATCSARRGGKPVGQVAPEQRPAWAQEEVNTPTPPQPQKTNRRQPVKTRPAPPAPQVQAMSGRPFPPPSDMRTSQNMPWPSKSNMDSTEGTNMTAKAGRPDLASSIGRKFGGAVSISKVTVNPPKKVRREVLEEPQIKEEPLEEGEEEEYLHESSAGQSGFQQQYPQEDYFEGEDEEYSAEADYPGYDDYGEDGEKDGAPPMFKSTRMMDD